MKQNFHLPNSPRIAQQPFSPSYQGAFLLLSLLIVSVKMLINPMSLLWYSRLTSGLLTHLVDEEARNTLAIFSVKSIFLGSFSCQQLCTVIPTPFLLLSKTLGRPLPLTDFRMEYCCAFPKICLELSVRHLWEGVSRRYQYIRWKIL